MADVNVTVTLPQLTTARPLTSGEKGKVQDAVKELVKGFVPTWPPVNATVEPGQDLGTFTVGVTVNGP